MIVAELIAELQKYDPGLVVSVLNEKDIPYYTDSIRVSVVKTKANDPWEGVHRPLRNKDHDFVTENRLIIEEDLWGNK